MKTKTRPQFPPISLKAITLPSACVEKLKAWGATVPAPVDQNEVR